MDLKLDKWQQDVLDTTGNIVLRSGRQCGKSTVIAQKSGDYALANKGKNVLVIAAVERQAFLIFEKILGYIYDTDKSQIRKGRFRPTKSKIQLKNGSTIYCLPTGLSGYGIRGYTIDLLIADEAAFIPDEVWAAVTPMLAVTRGDIILLSTPFGKGGYFFNAFSDPTFTSFHVSSEDCPRIPKEFLEQEQKRMTKLQYAQEYRGEFVDELRQFFPTALIEQCMNLTKDDTTLMTTLTKDPTLTKRFLGVDVARMGEDESVLFGLILHNNILYEQLKIITTKTRLTDTYREILDQDRKHYYKNIYIDDGGLGVGVFDMLLEEPQTRRRVVAINNAARSIEHGSERRKRVLKEDLYNNLLTLMERGKIKLHFSNETLLSLKSIQCEYTDTRMKIFGKYSHITEALIRAAWCVKSKSLNIYIR